MIYWQHRLIHIVPALWRVHRAHHSDTELDVTTGFRFHPIEMLLSLGLKVGTIILLRIPTTAAFLFEVMLSTSTLYTHGNLRQPRALKRVLRLLLLTPDMHRIHHSHKRYEADSNFGANFSFWDRGFRSYRARARRMRRN